jgi:hypothetical protein
MQRCWLSDGCGGGWVLAHPFMTYCYIKDTLTRLDPSDGRIKGIFGYDLAKIWLPFCFRENLSSISIWALPAMPLDAVLGQDKWVRRFCQKTLGEWTHSIRHIVTSPCLYMHDMAYFNGSSSSPWFSASYMMQPIQSVRTHVIQYKNCNSSTPPPQGMTTFVELQSKCG